MLRVKALALLSLCSATLCVAQNALWLDVPFVKQTGEGCGAASIAMVMQYWQQHAGVSATQSSDFAYIQQELYSKQAHGIYASDLQRYLEQHGYATYVVRGDEALLAQHIRRGRPLIVALQPTREKTLHYVVVVGVDGNKVVLINDPAQRKLLKVDSASFDKEWKATGNWTLLAVPRTSPQ